MVSSFIYLSVLLCAVLGLDHTCRAGDHTCEETSLLQLPRGRISLRQLRDAERKFTTSVDIAGSPQEVGRAELRASEDKFGKKAIQAAHGEIGGDRMTVNGYAPIYEKYLPEISGFVASPVVAEIGILTCTGVAMWTEVFPTSKVFGFDRNTTTCLNNFPALKALGFQDSRVTITAMDQTAAIDSNTKFVQSVFAGTRVNLVIDDGYHEPNANLQTFKTMLPVLADRFVYIVEDVYPANIENVAKWSPIWEGFKAACPECRISLEKPEDYEGHVKTSRLVVLTRRP